MSSHHPTDADSSGSGAHGHSGDAPASSSTALDARAQLTTYRRGMRKREAEDQQWMNEKEVDDRDPDLQQEELAPEPVEAAHTASQERIATGTDDIDHAQETEQPTATEPLQRPPDLDAPAFDPYNPSAQQQHQQQTAEQSDSNLAICRICLEGAGDGAEDGESLGRLLSPCRCKGTMKYVHATCLDRWRALSLRTSSVVACDQCGAPYRFRKSRFVGLATSPSLLFLVSIFLFLGLIWTTGFVASLVLQWYDSPLVPAELRTATRADAVKEPRTGGWWSWLGTEDDDAGQTDWDLHDDYTYGGYWGYGGGLFYERAAYVKLIKEAVRQFTSGEAGEAVKELVGIEGGSANGEHAEPAAIDAVAAEDEDDGRSFWQALKWEWTHGPDGIWPGQESPSDQPETTSAQPGGAVTPSAPAEPAPPVSDAPLATNPTPQMATKKRYDARSGREVPLKRGKSKRTTRRAPQTPQVPAQPSWLDRLLLHFSLGFSLVGILSFVNLVLGFGFLGPLNLNFGLGRTFARMTGGGGRRRGGGGGGGGGGGEGINLASLVVVLLVLVGVVRALMLVYRAVGKVARMALARVEEAVVDWYGEDEQVDSGREGEGQGVGGHVADARRVGGEDEDEDNDEDEDQRQVERQLQGAVDRQREERMAWLLARAGD